MRRHLILLLLLAQTSSASAQPAGLQVGGSAEKGYSVIIAKGCGACHVIPGVDGADGVVGPPLTGIARRIYLGGVLRNSPENLAAWVRDPQRFLPGSAMPSTGLTPVEAIDVAAYLRTLQ